MKFIRTLVCPVLLTASLLLVVRGLLVTHVQLPPDTAVYGLQPNQHVLVSLTYYGLKVPGEAIWGYHRWGYRVPEWGDAILFNLPRPKVQHGPGPETVGICHALPGETVWIDPVRQKVLPARTSPDAQPIVIPQRGRRIKITPHNARLMAYLLRTYEKGRAEANAQGELLIDGEKVHSVKTTRDYYWMETRPDAYVMVPHDALVGKIIYAHPVKKPNGKN